MTNVPRTAVLTVLLAGLVAGLCGCSGSDSTDSTPPSTNPAGVQISNSSEDQTFKGTEPAAPYEMPDITLTADNGDDFNLISDTAYPVTLVFFGFTHCRDECPLILNELAAVYRRLPTPVREQTQVLFITTDPGRDTPDVMHSYLRRFDTRFVGLTGRLPDLLAAAESMGVAVSGMEPLPGGGYDVGHSLQVVGFRDNDAPVIWTEDTPAADITADVVKLAS